MEKTIKMAQEIPLTKINAMEEDGINAFEKIKLEMAVKIITEMSMEQLNKLFKFKITDPRNENQQFDLMKKYREHPSYYNKSNFAVFRMLKNKGNAKVEAMLKIKV